MKAPINILILISTFSICYSANALTTIKTNNVSGGMWSVNTNWHIGNTSEIPETAPNSNTLEVQNEYSATSMVVDGEFTVGRIGANSDTGHSNNTGKFVWDLNPTAPDADAGVINIDSATLTNTENSAIDFGFLGQSKPEIYSQNITFSGGTINVFDSLDSSKSSVININGSSTAAEEEGISYVKSITFDLDNTLNIRNNTTFKASGGANQYKSQVFNLFGTVNVFDTVDDEVVYKNAGLYAASQSAAYTGVIMNIGDTSKPANENVTAIFTSGNFTMGATSVLNINGTMNVHGKFTMNDGSETAARTQLNIAKGASLTTQSGAPDVNNNFVLGSYSDTIIEGSLLVNNNATKTTSLTDTENSLNQWATLTIKKGGNAQFISDTELSVYLMLRNNSTLTVEEGASLTVRSQLRFAGSDARVKIYEANGIKSQEYGNRWKPVIVTSGVKDVYIDLYANQDWVYLSWWGANTEELTSTFHIYLGDDVSMITLDTLTESNGVNGLNNDYRFIILDNFRNNTIKVSKLNPYEADYMDQISAEGYEDFRFDFVNGVDGTDGYWLNATQVIPEPATCVILCGLAALGFAVFFRRK